MHHVAIMDAKRGFISRILSGKKTVESRWYSTRRAPWNTISEGDAIYFKESGKPITVLSTAGQVYQYDNLTPEKIKKILRKYKKQIDIFDINYFYDLVKNKKYGVLIFLENPKPTKPFCINKTGFGSAAAWLSVPNIKKLKTSKP